jgi:hypothetical protein
MTAHVPTQRHYELFAQYASELEKRSRAIVRDKLRRPHKPGLLSKALGRWFSFLAAREQ